VSTKTRFHELQEEIPSLSKAQGKQFFYEGGTLTLGKALKSPFFSPLLRVPASYLSAINCESSYCFSFLDKANS